MHTINDNTQIVIALFAIIYIIFLAVKTVKHQIDLYDFVMLSAVAMVPVGFAFYSKLAYWLAEQIGVAFPFVLMFGFLFFIIFIFVYRLTIKIHRLEKSNLQAVQEIGLLSVELRLISQARGLLMQDQTGATHSTGGIHSVDR